MLMLWLLLRLLLRLPLLLLHIPSAIINSIDTFAIITLSFTLGIRVAWAIPAYVTLLSTMPTISVIRLALTLSFTFALRRHWAELG